MHFDLDESNLDVHIVVTSICISSRLLLRPFLWFCKMWILLWTKHDMQGDILVSTFFLLMLLWFINWEKRKETWNNWGMDVDVLWGLLTPYGLSLIKALDMICLWLCFIAHFWNLRMVYFPLNNLATPLLPFINWLFF